MMFLPPKNGSHSNIFVASCFFTTPGSFGMLTPNMADPDTTVFGSEIIFQGPHCLRMTTGEKDVWHLVVLCPKNVVHVKSKWPKGLSCYVQVYLCTYITYHIYMHMNEVGPYQL